MKDRAISPHSSSNDLQQKDLKNGYCFRHLCSLILVLYSALNVELQQTSGHQHTKLRGLCRRLKVQKGRFSVWANDFSVGEGHLDELFLDDKQARVRKNLLSLLMASANALKEGKASMLPKESTERESALCDTTSKLQELLDHIITNIHDVDWVSQLDDGLRSTDLYDSDDQISERWIGSMDLVLETLEVSNDCLYNLIPLLDEKFLVRPCIPSSRAPSENRKQVEVKSEHMALTNSPLADTKAEEDCFPVDERLALEPLIAAQPSADENLARHEKSGITEDAVGEAKMQKLSNIILPDTKSASPNAKSGTTETTSDSPVGILDITSSPASQAEAQSLPESSGVETELQKIRDDILNPPKVETERLNETVVSSAEAGSVHSFLLTAPGSAGSYDNLPYPEQAYADGHEPSPYAYVAPLGYPGLGSDSEVPNQWPMPNPWPVPNQWPIPNPWPVPNQWPAPNPWPVPNQWPAPNPWPVPNPWPMAEQLLTDPEILRYSNDNNAFSAYYPHPLQDHHGSQYSTPGMGAVGQWGTPSYYHSSPWPGSTHGSEIVTTFAHRTAASTSIGPVMSSGDNATPYQPTGYLSPSEQLEREFPALYQIYSEPPQLRESLKLPDLPTDWWFDDHSLQEASTDTGYFSLGDAAEATQSGGSDLEEYSLEEPKVTTKDGARVYTCRYERCGRDFKRKCEYTRHFTEDHLLSSKYVCNHNSELFREVISAHPGSAGCPLKEGGCGRRFKDKKHFRKHVMYQHLTINPSKKDKRLLKQRNEYTAERSTEQEAKLEAREAGAGGEKQPCSPGVECGPGSPSCKSVQVEPSQSLAEKTTTRPLTHGTNSSETESEVGNLRAVDSPHRDGSAFGLDTAVSPRPNQSTTEAK